MKDYLIIGGRKIGEGQPVFIIAELSANHLGRFDLAVKTLHAMKKAGADAVKLQTYTPDTITLNCSNRYFKIRGGTPWDGQTLYKLYGKACTPWEWHPKLKTIAQKLGLLFFSSPFDKTAVDFLKKMEVPAYKIASCEITDIPLIEYIAAQGKPIVISTGIATFKEIQEAVAACRRKDNDRIALLKCTSVYPTPFEEVNLRMLPRLKKDFHCVVGVSDHTLGSEVPLASVVLGASIVEKHFILDKKLKGPDTAFSMDPGEFAGMVDAIRAVEKALGEGSYHLSKTVAKNRAFRRSLFVVADIHKGGIITEKNVRSIRPGDGLGPKHLYRVLGKRACKDLKRGTPLCWEMIARGKDDFS